MGEWGGEVSNHLWYMKICRHLSHSACFGSCNILKVLKFLIIGKNSIFYHNINYTACSPLRFMVVFWFGSTRLPSSHKTRVPLRFAATLTVAVDVMDVPVITSVTLNSKGWSDCSWLLGTRVWEMLRDGTLHWCTREGTVHVNTICSPGHGLSTLDCNWAPETAKGQCFHLETTHKKLAFSCDQLSDMLTLCQWFYLYVNKMLTEHTADSYIHTCQFIPLNSDSYNTDRFMHTYEHRLKHIQSYRFTYIHTVSYTT